MEKIERVSIGKIIDFIDYLANSKKHQIKMVVHRGNLIVYSFTGKKEGNADCISDYFIMLDISDDKKKLKINGIGILFIIDKYLIEHYGWFFDKKYWNDFLIDFPTKNVKNNETTLIKDYDGSIVIHNAKIACDKGEK